MTKLSKSLVDIEWMNSFPSQYPHKSYFNYVANNVGLESVLAVAGTLCPDFIERDGYILLAENCEKFRGDQSDFSNRFGSDRKTIERYINLISLSDFFLLASDEASESNDLLFNFAQLLKYFWSHRLKELFPSKEFEFEVSKDIYDEEGLCLTFWQKA